MHKPEKLSKIFRRALGSLPIGDWFVEFLWPGTAKWKPVPIAFLARMARVPPLGSPSFSVTFFAEVDVPVSHPGPSTDLPNALVLMFKAIHFSMVTDPNFVSFRIRQEKTGETIPSVYVARECRCHE